LIYDSTNAGASESVAFISGSQPNLLFEVTILDAFGNKMGQTNNAYIIQILPGLKLFKKARRI